MLASALTALFGVGMAVMGVLAVASKPNLVTAGIGGVLWVWAGVLAWAARGMWWGRRWSRGPVVAGGLLHLASFANFAGNQPLALLPAGLALAAVAAAVWPTTTSALHFGAAGDEAP